MVSSSSCTSTSASMDFCIFFTTLQLQEGHPPHVHAAEVLRRRCLVDEAVDLALHRHGQASQDVATALGAHVVEALTTARAKNTTPVDSPQQHTATSAGPWRSVPSDAHRCA